MTPHHRVRPLMSAAMRGDFAATDPFLALIEDWFPRGVSGKHPHRGIETVTYVIEGRIDHYDNQGHEGMDPLEGSCGARGAAHCHYASEPERCAGQGMSRAQHAVSDFRQSGSSRP